MVCVKCCFVLILWHTQIALCVWKLWSDLEALGCFMPRDAACLSFLFPTAHVCRAIIELILWLLILALEERVGVFLIIKVLILSDSETLGTTSLNGVNMFFNGGRWAERWRLSEEFLKFPSLNRSLQSCCVSLYLQHECVCFTWFLPLMNKP